MPFDRIAGGLGYTPEEQAKMDKVAAEAAKKEFDNDKNRTDPKGTQDRVNKAISDLRKGMGLEQ